MRSLVLILSNSRYFGPSWVFASVNLLFGTWAIYIPTVKEKLGIDKADLGFALFFLSLGVFTVFPFAAKIIDRIGVGRATWFGVLWCCLAALLPLMATNYYSLLGGLFIFGAGTGFTDISMNTLVTEIEKEDKQYFMSASHGFFSLGGVLAGLGSFFVVPIGNPVVHMGGAVCLVFIVNFIFHFGYKKVVSVKIPKVPFNLKLYKPLLVLGLISFIVMGSEGAVVDWSGLFLKEISMAPESLIGAGFLGFSITMTVGRFLGDSIGTKLSAIAMISLGTVIAIIGYVLVLSTITYLAISGFALIGLGFSVIIPVLFRIGGNLEGVESSQGVSFIAGTGYLGFLLGPVILGFLAESYSLKHSFTALLACAAIVLGTTYILKKSKD